MQFKLRKMETRDPDGFLHDALEPVIRGLGLSLIELSVFRGKERRGILRNVQVRAVVLSGGITGVEDCSRVHRALIPRLELAFPEQEIYLEVSSPGIDRLIKDGSEFANYTGKRVRCLRTDISDWTVGVLSAVDEEKIVLETEDGETTLSYDIIAKARLDGAPCKTGG